MITTLRSAGASLAAMALLAAIPAAAAGAGGGRTLDLPNTADSVAMNGPVAAVGLEGACPRIVAWNVVSGARQTVSGGKTCDDGLLVRAVAVAGRSVAWIVDGASNSEAYDGLLQATLPHPSEREDATSDRTGDNANSGKLAGTWLSAPVADGGAFAYASWETREPGGPVFGVRIHRSGGGATAVRVSPSTWVAPQAGDSGLLVALAGDGRIAVLGRNGRLIRLVRPLRAPAFSTCRDTPTFGPGNGLIGLRKGRLAFVTEGHTLDVYQASSGALVHSYPVPAAAAKPCEASGVDLYYGYALYGTGHAVHVLKLASGRDRVLATARKGLGPFALEAPGAVYASYQGGAHLQFVPFARLRQLVG